MKNNQLIFHYHGTLQDTAVLIGMKNVKVRLDHITYCGERSFLFRSYLLTLNRWLEKQGLPVISTTRGFPVHGLKVSTENTLSAWGWEDPVCKAAIRLEGLPLPPHT